MKCKICNIAFHNENVLFRHLKIKHPLQSYICIRDGCTRQLITLSLLKQHSIKCDKNSLLKTNSSLKNESSVIVTNTNKKIRLSIEHENCNEPIIEEDLMKTKVFDVIGKLYANPIVAKETVQIVSSSIIEYTKHLTMFFSQRLKLKFPESQHEHIDESLHINFLDQTTTDFKRLQYFKNAGYYIEAKPFEIGEIIDSKKKNKVSIWTKRKCLAYVVPLPVVLKMILELPNFFNEVLSGIRVY